MFRLLRRDIQRRLEVNSATGQPGFREKVRILSEATALQGIAVYRFGSWTARRCSHGPLGWLARAVHYFLDTLTVMMWGMHIDRQAEIGPGLYVAYPNGVRIGPAKIGSDCNIGPNVIIGLRTDGRGADGVPTLGDRVWIGTGSLLFGGIYIGDGTSVAPLTVVGRNLPPRCLAVGNPMRVLSRDYDNTRQIYGAGRMADRQDDADSGTSLASGLS